MPTLLTGIKISLTISITGAVVGEFITSESGLGYLLNLGRGQFDTALVFVALLTLAFIAILAYGLVTLLEKILLSWQ
jgi:NitT/TauT family transport system permease protein